MMLCREGVARIGTRMGFDFNHKWQIESDLDHIRRAGRETTRDRSARLAGIMIAEVSYRPEREKLIAYNRLAGADGWRRGGRF